MPYDAILIASRVMVAKEANTSLEAKKLLVNTPGIESEEEWENSYHTSAGGIITVKSELGEPIHKVLTRGLEVWKDFDDQFFSLPSEKMVQKIAEKKQYIINRLNADFQKVYFGRTLVCSLLQPRGKPTCLTMLSNNRAGTWWICRR